MNIRSTRDASSPVAAWTYAVDDYENEFEERHVDHSNALHSVIRKRGAYQVGPLARYALNFDRLTPAMCRGWPRRPGSGEVCRNPFKSIIVRAVELIYACDEALRLIADYRQPDEPAVRHEPKAGEGCAATEAPRGMLYHRYRLADDGSIVEARIVPPTSQNQGCTEEEDLMEVAGRGLDLSDDDLRHNCELAIRNYDPCISCATHFLKVSVHRS